MPPAHEWLSQRVPRAQGCNSQRRREGNTLALLLQQIFRSHRYPAAVDVDRGSVHVARPAGGEEDNRLGDLLRMRGAAQRNRLGDGRKRIAQAESLCWPPPDRYVRQLGPGGTRPPGSLLTDTVLLAYGDSVEGCHAN